VALVIDAGGWIALERGNANARARYALAIATHERVVTHGGIVGQVWRARGARQARLAHLLAAAVVEPVDDALGRRAGALLARTGGRDVLDAALVLVATDGDEILTSDPADLAQLAAAAELTVDLIVV